MQHRAHTARTAVDRDSDTVVVHVQLRPRRGATRRCLSALAGLAAEHESVALSVAGLSKDDRIVRITVAVELGPRSGVARFSPQAQAAYAFVSELFTALYDHMPAYCAEPSASERAAAATLLEAVAGGNGSAADPAKTDTSELAAAAMQRVTAPRPPAPRPPAPGERIPA